MVVPPGAAVDAEQDVGAGVQPLRAAAGQHQRWGMAGVRPAQPRAVRVGVHGDDDRRDQRVVTEPGQRAVQRGEDGGRRGPQRLRDAAQHAAGLGHGGRGGDVVPGDVADHQHRVRRRGARTRRTSHRPPGPGGRRGSSARPAPAPHRRRVGEQAALQPVDQGDRVARLRRLPDRGGELPVAPQPQRRAHQPEDAGGGDPDQPHDLGGERVPGVLAVPDPEDRGRDQGQDGVDGGGPAADQRRGHQGDDGEETQSGVPTAEGEVGDDQHEQRDDRRARACAAAGARDRRPPRSVGRRRATGIQSLPTGRVSAARSPSGRVAACAHGGSTSSVIPRR